jgi:integrase/recombinase XerD
MLTIYRRHRKECLHRKDGRAYRRCHCPIWVDGYLSDTEIRKSLGTRDWQKAQDTIRRWEADGQRTRDVREPETLDHAKQSYLADAVARKLAEPTVYKYTLLLRHLAAFAEERGLRTLKELTVEELGVFRSRWKDGPLSAGKKLERLRTFLRFCERRKWVTENAALDLKPPKVIQRPTMPFTSDEMTRILAAAGEYGETCAVNARDNARRIRALILLLRYSGMRIGDTVSLTADRIMGDRLFLYTAKTGTPVHIVLPEFVVRALEATPRVTERYFFWSGAGKLNAAISTWGERLQRVFKKAAVTGGHAHRFRDTFAVELLQTAVPIERVSVLLGHQSVRITEKHYNPWVRSRQEQLEADVRRSWARDPLALMETKGTPEVHGDVGALN